MLAVNKVGRFDLAQDVIRGVLRVGANRSLDVDAHTLISGYQHRNRELVKYAEEHGEGESMNCHVLERVLVLWLKADKSLDPKEFSTAVLLEA